MASPIRAKTSTIVGPFTSDTWAAILTQHEEYATSEGSGCLEIRVNYDQGYPVRVHVAGRVLSQKKIP